MSQEGKLSKEDFVLQAIRRLRKPPYKGIHVRYSGFNQAFKEYFNEEAKSTVDKMVAEGKITTRMRRGGPMLYLPDEVPEDIDVLGKILEGS
jgi:hypothetical protein